jgi:transcription elongation factor Elf1
MKDAKEYTCYRGAKECPECGSEDTASDCIATSSRWMDFLCHECGHGFRRAARSVSPLSADLGKLAREASDIFDG